MNKFIIGLLLLGSFSSLAAEVKCGTAYSGSSLADANSQALVSLNKEIVENSNLSDLSIAQSVTKGNGTEVTICVIVKD